MSGDTPIAPRPLFVHVRLEDLVVAIERRREPAWNEVPLVVGGDPRSPGAVMAASLEARATGVRTGQRLRDAARCCPGAVFLPGSVDAYVDAAARAFEIVLDASPRAEWLELDEGCFVVEPDAGARGIVERVRQALADTLAVQVACGVATSRVAARAAARLVAPSGVLVVLRGYERRFLAGLALECLDGIDGDAAERLRAAGLATVGDLDGLSAHEPDRALALLGRAARTLLPLAAGDDRRDLRRGLCPPRLVRRVRVGQTDAPARALASVAAQLAASLARHAWTAAELEVETDAARAPRGANRRHTALEASSLDARGLEAAARTVWNQLGAARASATDVVVRLRGVRAAAAPAAADARAGRGVPRAPVATRLPFARVR